MPTYRCPSKPTPSRAPARPRDTWLLIVEPMRIHHADLGLDAAFIGLAKRVGKRVRALLAEGSEERARLLPLLVRLHLADCDGSLATLLERSAHVIDRKPEALPHV